MNKTPMTRPNDELTASLLDLTGQVFGQCFHGSPGPSRMQLLRAIAALEEVQAIPTPTAQVMRRKLGVNEDGTAIEAATK